MARIRSVHPGLFTDEAFAGLSCDAQMLLIGIWTEADDQGVFEWKPVTLRMRLRPTKDGAVEPLLAELVEGDCIRQFEVAGRKYGAVRNFRKYQRPKKPNAVHPMTPEIGIYVALNGVSSEPDDDEGEASTEPKTVKPTPVPPKGEIAPQMEDGGGRLKGKDGGDSTSGAAPQLPQVALVPFIEIPTNRFESSGEQFPVCEPVIEEFRKLYPAVDVRGELRKMRGWSIANPAQRKTRKGMSKFINSWLSRQQDKSAPRETFGGRNGGQSSHQSFSSTVSRVVSGRSSGRGLFGGGGAEIIIPADPDNPPRDDGEDEIPRLAHNAA
jgi:hypothetical protein